MPCRARRIIITILRLAVVGPEFRCGRNTYREVCKCADHRLISLGNYTNIQSCVGNTWHAGLAHQSIIHKEPMLIVDSQDRELILFKWPNSTARCSVDVDEPIWTTITRTDHRDCLGKIANAKQHKTVIADLLEHETKPIFLMVPFQYLGLGGDI
jgi:hypothetical protein